MSITREDRWKHIIDRLKFGADIGVERKKRPMKKRKLISIGGRQLSPKEACILSGIPDTFFYGYTDREVPIEDILDKLDAMWVKEKVKKLNMENFFK